MQLQQHLLDTFEFNDRANRQLLTKIKLLRDPTEAIKFLSHLINSQRKWMARLKQDPEAPRMDWWTPVYALDALEEEWGKSLEPWLAFVRSHSEDELCIEATFTGFDGARWAATPKDIALQLNYHSIHHRAQIQIILHQQDVQPDFVDYIGTRYRKLS